MGLKLQVSTRIVNMNSVMTVGSPGGGGVVPVHAVPSASLLTLLTTSLHPQTALRVPLTHT